MTLDVRQVPINTLRPHPSNPRNGDVERIKESLIANGQYKPIVAAQGGVILAGNHTYAAAMELGWTEMDAVLLDIPPTGPAALRIMLADNRTSDLGLYDTGILYDLLRELDENDTTLGTGYSEQDVDDLRALVESAPLSFHDEIVDRLPSMADKLERYQEMGRRMIVLDYTQEEYPEVTAALTALRQRMGVESNAVAVRMLLEESAVEA